MRDTILRLSIGNPSQMSSQDEGRVSIQIEDPLSGETLGYVTMTAGRFHQLQLGTSLTYHAQISDHLDRVGKKLRVEQIRVPSEVTDKIPYSKTKQDHKEAIQAWLDAGNKPEHWETVSIGHHNYGWSVTGRWWVELTPAEIADFEADQITYNDKGL